MRAGASLLRRELPCPKLQCPILGFPPPFSLNRRNSVCLDVLQIGSTEILSVDDFLGVALGDSTRKSVRKLCKEERLDEAIQVAVPLLKPGISISRETIYCLLQECSKKKDVAAGRRVQSLIVSSALQSDILLKENLVRMFASSGSLLEAYQVFCELSKPSLYAWNAIISSHASFGESKKALEFFHKMQEGGIEPDNITYLYVLKACSCTHSIGQGRLIHEQVIKSRLGSSLVIGNTLINMYSKCNRLEEGRKVFDTLPNRDVVSWGSMIAGYAQHGQGGCALELFGKMQDEGIVPNMVIFLGTLKACASIGALVKGNQIHDWVIRRGLDSDVIIGSTLIDMYVKCGKLKEAHELFNRLQNRNIVSWTAMIAGYVQHGHGIPAFDLFEQLKQEGMKPDKFIFSCILKVCGSTTTMEQGRLIHCHIINSGFKSDVAVGNSLVDMYAKCGNLEEAHRVFDGMSKRDVASWCAIISGYVQHGHGLPAFELFRRMHQAGFKPDKFIFSCILKACGSIGRVEFGEWIHCQIVRRGLMRDVIIGNVLVDMYSKCGSLEEAHKVFDDLPNRDIVSWGAMISGYAQHGHGLHALDLFAKMQQEGIHPDTVAFLSILKACGSIGATCHGRLMHAQIIKDGLGSDLIIGNALVDMYAKCGSLQEARKVFDELPNRVVVTWGAMIAGYAQNGHSILALELLDRMQQEGMKPDNITFLCILKACCSMGAVKQGRLIHSEVIRSGLHSDVAVGNTLIDMYAKCGSLEEARKVFDELQNRNVVSWNAMMTGYVQHEHSLLAVAVWRKMQEECIKPSQVTFLCMLKACGSMEAIDQGRAIHDQIIRSRLDANVVVGNTLVDMYAKCGSLEDALEVFNKLLNPDLVSWNAIISAYIRHGNYDMAEKCLEDMQRQGLKPNDEIFTGILAACRQAGLVEEGCRSFKSMTDEHGIVPCLENYSCMVDILGHAGCLNEAAVFLHKMPFEPDATVWTSLLSSCRLYGNLELGKYCFDKLVQLNPTDASGYVLMSKMCADFHMWDDVDKIRELRKSSGAQKKPGRAWIEVSNEVHEFVVGGNNHSQSDDLYVKLDQLVRPMKQEGYVPQVESIMDLILIEKKQDALCGRHYEKLELLLNQHIQEHSYESSVCVR